MDAASAVAALSRRPERGQTMRSIRFFDEIFSGLQVEARFDGQLVGAEQFALREETSSADSALYTGCWEQRRLRMQVRRLDPHTISMHLGLESAEPFHCDQLRVSFLYEEPGADLSACCVPGGGLNCGVTGLHRLSQRPVTPEDVRFCGLFRSSREPCLLFGTQLPSSWMLLYQAALEQKDRVRFTAVNRFTGSQADQYSLSAETILVFTGLTPPEAVARYGRTLPPLPAERFADPLIGWSTWDYYFTAFGPEDIAENMRQIRADPALSSRVRCIFVDDGWQHREGEWHANYRFPEGAAGIAQQIVRGGFEPGIWTNGCQVWPLSEAGLRRGQMFLRDSLGNAITFEGRYIIDPTHPDGEAYLFETYRRLREDGFRLFKVDFVSALLLAERFFESPCGPYDAIRRLFSIIRRAVGPESTIIGCSYPADCGPGYVDSSRYAVDIHNHWSHVLWILETMQLSFWENGRLYRVDPDFLVVRGRDTSSEAETEVFNPFPNAPYVLDSPANRWRRGPVFDRWEAETWANLAVFSAGNLILSDRLSRLNSLGRALIETHLQPNRSAAVPLDLGDGAQASVWYSREDRKLLVINLREEAAAVQVPCAAYSLEIPQTAVCSKPFSYSGGLISVELHRHESAAFTW